MSERLVTVLVIDFDDPSDAAAFAAAVKLVVRTTRKLTLLGGIRIEAYGDLAAEQELRAVDDEERRE